MKYPFGMTWPGDGTAHRSSDGRNVVDYIGMILTRIKETTQLANPPTSMIIDMPKAVVGVLTIETHCHDTLAAAAKFRVASPTPWEYLDGQGNPNNGGANFGVGGAAVTNAWGVRPLDQQVDKFEALVKGGTWTAAHLAQSVALVSIGVNDYTYYNQHGSGIKVWSVLIVTNE